MGSLYLSCYFKPALELGMALNFGYLVLAVINHLEIDERIIVRLPASVLKQLANTGMSVF